MGARPARATGMDAPPPADPPVVASAPAPAGCLTPELSASLVTLHPRGGPIVATIAPGRGGQLVGLQLRRDGRTVELLHRGMDFCPVEDFDGKAPILWPATGRTYLPGPSAPPRPGWEWQGRRYAMPIHGFARDRAWQVVGTSRSRRADAVTLRLADDAATRRLYPFAFAMTVTYRLRGRVLTIDHRVMAGRNATAMPFSIGNHVTFALPLGGRGRAGEATVTTDAGDRVVLDAAGRPSGRVAQPALRGVAAATLGRQRALPIAGLRSGRPAAMLTQPGWGAITLRQRSSLPATGDPVRFNLWGDADAGYFSIEPWLGLQNSLATGDGLVRLPPGRSFRWTLTLRIDEAT